MSPRHRGSTRSVGCDASTRPTSLRARFDGSTWTELWDHQFGTTWHVEQPDGVAQFLKVRAPAPHRPCSTKRAHALGAGLPARAAGGRRGHRRRRRLAADRPPRGHRRSASPAARQDPTLVVRSIARSLHAFHERPPISSCPFDFRLATALDHARQRVAAGLVDAWSSTTSSSTTRSPGPPGSSSVWIAADGEDVVVCHGDPCFPNFLLDDAGVVTGYVDLGELCVAAASTSPSAPGRAPGTSGPATRPSSTTATATDRARRRSGSTACSPCWRRDALRRDRDRRGGWRADVPGTRPDDRGILRLLHDLRAPPDDSARGERRA